MTKKKEPTLIDQLDYLLERERFLERKIGDSKERHNRDLLEKDLAAIRAKIPELRDQIAKDPSITKIEDLKIGQKVKLTPSLCTHERLKGTSWEKLIGKVVTVVGLHSGNAILPSMSGTMGANEEVWVIDEEDIPSQECHHAVYDVRAADLKVRFRR